MIRLWNGERWATPTLASMGLNPFRQQERSAADIAMVVGALVLTVAAILWAILAG